MTGQILRACTCGHLHPGHCPTKTRARDKRRGTRQQRGLDNHWLRLAAQAIRRQPFCSYCGTTGSRDNPLTGDHRHPRSKGGSARTANDIIVACRSCNSSRGDRTDWPIVYSLDNPPTPTPSVRTPTENPVPPDFPRIPSGEANP